MPILSGSIKRPPRPASEATLYQQAQQQRGVAAGMDTLVRMRLADIADPTDEIRRQRQLAAADTAQQMGALGPGEMTRAGVLDRALRRSRALTRVGMMGEEAARMQSIRDRASVASFGQSLQRGQTSSLAGLAGSQAITDASRMQARQLQAASRANMIGTVLGGIAASPWAEKGANRLKQWWQGRSSPAGSGPDVGHISGLVIPDNPLLNVGMNFGP